MVELPRILNWESKNMRLLLVFLYFALWLVKNTRAILSTNQMQN